MCLFYFIYLVYMEDHSYSLPPQERELVSPKKRKRELKRERDRRYKQTCVQLGRTVFPRWRELMRAKDFQTDAEVACFLLDRFASSLQNHPANQSSRRPPIRKKGDAPDLSPHDVCVNLTCLLQLFLRCGPCGGKCVVRKHGGKMDFTVFQHCQICNLLTTWTSQPSQGDEESVGQGEVTGGNPTFTDSHMMTESFDMKTDTESSREDSLWTDEDIKTTEPAEAAEPEESASKMMKMRMMMMMRGTQTDGGASRKTEEDLKENTQQGEDKLDPFPEVELTLEEDRDGGEEKREEGEGGVVDKIIIKEEEAENAEESETEEEEEEDEDEWEMDDEEEEEEEEEEWSERETNKARKVKKKRARDEDPEGDKSDPRYKRKGVMYMMNYRRRYQIKGRPETLCTDCGRLYRTLTHKCDPKKKFQCPDCGMFCLTDLSLSVHRDGHCRSRYQLCVFCLEPFKTRRDRLAHEMSHVGPQPYECPDCPLRFSDRYAQSLHLKEHPKSFRCQSCPKVFTILTLLKRHELNHSANKPFKCEVCEREFSQASQLKSHTRVHTGEKPFQCRLCPKRFNHNISLRNHVARYHQGESRDHAQEQERPAPRERGEGDHAPEHEHDDRPGQERVEGQEVKDGRSQKQEVKDGRSQKQEMKDGRSQKQEMEDGRSQKQDNVAFRTELDVTRRGRSEEGDRGGQGRPAYPKTGSQEEAGGQEEAAVQDSDSPGRLNDDQDSDFDPQQERVTSKRRGRGRPRGRARGRGRSK